MDYIKYDLYFSKATTEQKDNWIKFSNSVMTEEQLKEWNDLDNIYITI